MHIFEYPITRPVFFGRYLTVLIILGAGFWIAMITLINVAAQAYELVPIMSTSYSSSYSLWYERIFPFTSWLPKARTCEGSTIKILEGLSFLILPLKKGVSTDIRGFFTYVLMGYIDQTPGDPVDGLLYNQTAINNCTIEWIGLHQPVSDVEQDRVTIECNASTEQWFALKTGSDVASLGIPQVAFDLLYYYESSLVLLDTLNLWAVLTQALLSILWSPGGMSMFLPSVSQNNLTSIDIYYVDWVNSTTRPNSPNTPAGDCWTIYVVAISPGEVYGVEYPITFLPTGEVDFGHTDFADFENADALLAPTTEWLKLYWIADETFDIWKLLNWMFVSAYWVFLADFGQIAPTIYAQSDTDLASALFFPSTNNIFVNETLFEVYSSYLHDIVLPILQKVQPALTIPDFTPLNGSNRLQSTDVSFLRSYSCIQRQSKGWISAAISVLVADYAFIMGPYSLFALIAGWYQRRKDNCTS